MKTVFRILQFGKFYHLNKEAYHIHAVHKLQAEDYASWKAMYYDLLEASENNNLGDVLLPPIPGMPLTIIFYILFVTTTM